mgnify:CR=1 FL=1
MAQLLARERALVQDTPMADGADGGAVQLQVLCEFAIQLKG